MTLWFPETYISQRISKKLTNLGSIALTFRKLFKKMSQGAPNHRNKSLKGSKDKPKWKGPLLMLNAAFTEALQKVLIFSYREIKSRKIALVLENHLCFQKVFIFIALQYTKSFIVIGVLIFKIAYSESAILAYLKGQNLKINSGTSYVRTSLKHDPSIFKCVSSLFILFIYLSRHFTSSIRTYSTDEWYTNYQKQNWKRKFLLF